VCQAFGLKCELHGAGWRWAHTQLLGATSEATCEYYERGLLLPGVDGNDAPPYLEAIADPMGADGYVTVPETPGLGMQLNWDYIEDNRIEPSDEADYAPGVGNAYS
jgi:L-alanine-DL-glutamate epimerase-like enolase superfamily enzyme